MSKSTSSSSDSISIGEIIDISWWSIRLHLRINGFDGLMLIVVNVVEELSGLINAFIISLTLDQAISLASSNSSMGEITPYIGALVIFNFIFSILSKYSSYLDTSVRNRTRFDYSQILFEKVNQLGIQTIEDPEVADQVSRAGDPFTFYNLVDRITRIITYTVSFIISAIIVWQFAPIFILLVGIIGLSQFFINRYYLKRDFRWWFDNSEAQRSANWTVSQLNTPTTLQEITIIGAYNYLANKYIEFKDRFVGKFLEIRKRWEIANSVNELLQAGFSFIGYYNILYQLVNNLISAGTALFYFRSLNSLIDTTYRFSGRINSAYEFALKVKDFKDLMQAEAHVKEGAIKVDSTQAPEIEINNLSFKYPRTEKNIFNNLNLKIAKGEKVAIVGHNGAGKSTLIKLLARFYDAQKGEILVNNYNLKDLNLDSWYETMGILFQDFMRYGQLTVKENIAIGTKSQIESDDDIKNAAKLADAHDFIEGFPQGYDQILTERLRGGIQPSSGQWQKIAIARFFYRNSPFVIFDEPTAAIDPVAEYNIFNRIYEFFEGKTVIIVSHRFSTVRNADRIIVMEAGKIVQEGSHDQLLKQDGQYAEAFRLQSEGYN